MKTNVATLVVLVVGAVVLLWYALAMPATPMRITGLAIAIPSFLLLVAARVQLGGSFSVRPRASELVTTGIYARIRNPIYVFSALAIAGGIIWTERPIFLLILAVIVPAQMVRVRKEEQVLEAKFGTAYLEYKRKTWF
jgi:protein-S-isoprenylcysteine O-methyltransferase Ste14